ncbi:MAG: hypothetical protein GX799_00105 [Crenarchaeota archaeon]|nr:hypothetical protein [Thermoproteota archaeon]
MNLSQRWADCMVYCGKCVYGKQEIDEKGIPKSQLALDFLSPLPKISNPCYKCDLDGKTRFGIDGCDKGKSRAFTWKDMFR